MAEIIKVVINMIITQDSVGFLGPRAQIYSIDVTAY